MALDASSDTLYVRFATARSLLEQEPHLSHGGIFIPVPDPPPTPLDRLSLRFLFPGGGEATLAAQVVQITPGAGMALTFEQPEKAAEVLSPALLQARESNAVAEPFEDTGDGAAITVSRQRPEGVASGSDSDQDDEAPGTLYDRIKNMTTQERMQLARHGKRPERLLLAKDLNRTVHLFLLQNPRITLDEVRMMAGNRQTGTDVLEAIAKNRDWSQNPGIVQALVRNPKTAVPTAVRLLDRVPAAELRRLAKSNDVRRPISVAVRKKVQSKG